jgi:hypothetical protein
LTTATAPFRLSLLVDSLVNAGALLVRVVSTLVPPFVLVPVFVDVVVLGEELFVPVVVVG